MRATIYTVERSGPGTISTMARPRAGDWLEDEMRALSLAGTHILVSMLTETEENDLGLVGEESAALAAGLRFIRLRTPDMGVPQIEVFDDHVESLAEALRSRANVVVHCRGGLGRCSTLVAGVLIAEGVPLDEAWQRISRARGLDVPETDAQRAFVSAFASRSRRSAET